MGQHLVGKRGCEVTLAQSGLKSVVPFADDKELQKVYRVGEWNDMRVVAKGNMLVMWVNGVRTATVMDARPEFLPAKGYISIQLHQGRPMKAEFRAAGLQTETETPRRSLLAFMSQTSSSPVNFQSDTPSSAAMKVLQ